MIRGIIDQISLIDIRRKISKIVQIGIKDTTKELKKG